jgi:replicative DNA helicase
VNSVIASNDNEIREYINNWCGNNDAELVQESKYKLRIRRKGYSYGKEALGGEKYENIPLDKCDRTNPFTDLLKKYNLVGNKHIPNEYLFNDRESRLKLLAGIIDTDGHVTKESKGKRVCIIQTGKIFSEQIIYLAKSLGFLVNHRIRERKNCVIFNCEPKDYKDQYVINISGEKLEEIPTILPRKKCANSAPNKDYFKTAISVKKIGFGNYYGWNINDNHRDFQLTHLEPY